MALIDRFKKINIRALVFTIPQQAVKGYRFHKTGCQALVAQCGSNGRAYNSFTDFASWTGNKQRAHE